MAVVLVYAAMLLDAVNAFSSNSWTSDLATVLLHHDSVLHINIFIIIKTSNAIVREI